METEDQRVARLARVSAKQSERLATETEVQKAARLARLSANQSERLATETEEQRAARLARLSANHEVLQHAYVQREAGEEWPRGQAKSGPTKKLWRVPTKP